MGEDRRQGDRRQGDRRQEVSQPNLKTTKKISEYTISLKAFIIIVVIALILIAGIMWYTINQVKVQIEDYYNYEEYYDDEEYYDEDEYYNEENDIEESIDNEING